MRRITAAPLRENSLKPLDFYTTEAHGIAMILEEDIAFFGFAKILPVFVFTACY